MIPGTSWVWAVLAACLPTGCITVAQPCGYFARLRRSRNCLKTATRAVTVSIARMSTKSDISHLLITSKSWAAGSALREIRYRIGNHTTIVAMMNGTQHIDDIQMLAPECTLFLFDTAAVIEPVNNGSPRVMEKRRWPSGCQCSSIMVWYLAKRHPIARMV